MADYAEILPGLFMGGEGLLPIPPNGFDVVISCREVADIAVPSLKDILEQGGPVLLSVKMIDAPIEVPIWKVITTTQYIGAVRNYADPPAQKVLVHCKQGLNRSGLIVAAYLILEEGWPADDAIAKVREKRPGALSNETFVAQLRLL